MAKIEKIQGDTILQLFQELQQDLIPLKVLLTNEDHERLTHMVNIRKWKKTPYFLIEDHEGFQKAADDLDGLRLHFKFVGNDGIKYAFETDGSKKFREMIWIRYPEIVWRYQRRSLFRLEAPHGTRLYFNVNDVRYKLLVINVSLSGTLGVLASLTKKTEKELRLYNPKILENVELVFPSKGDDHNDSKVNIKRCRIIRQERNLLTQKYECAVKFKEMTENEQEKLKELFYEWQREYLRKRRLFNL